MSLYFDWKAPLGMKISPVMSEESFEDDRVLLQRIASVSPKDMMKDFLLIELGAKSVEYDEGVVDRILHNQKEALVFIAKKAVLTSQQKAVMLDFISNPEKIKEDDLHLLKWYEEHVYSTSPYDVKRLKKSRKYLQRNLSTHRNEYLLKLMDNLHYEELNEDRMILLVLCTS